MSPNFRLCIVGYLQSALYIPRLGEGGCKVMQGLRPLARLANNQVQNNVTEEFGPEHLILMEAPIPNGRRIAIGKFNFSAKDCKQLKQEQAGGNSHVQNSPLCSKVADPKFQTFSPRYLPTHPRYLSNFDAKETELKRIEIGQRWIV